MPSNTTNVGLLLQDTGSNVGTWGAELNSNDFQIIDNVFGGLQTLSLSSIDITVTTSQSQNNFIKLTGILTANVNVFFPVIGRTFAIYNNTTGSFTVTLAITGTPGATAISPQGTLQAFVMDGTNVYPITGGAPPAGSIANSQLANMAATTFKANNTGSSAAPLDITETQATAMINAFVGDTGSGGTKGSVPAPSSGDAAAYKVLGASGGWVQQGIGYGQTWQNVAASRSYGTAYQNTTSKPIFVSILARSYDGGPYFQVSNDGVTYFDTGALCANAAGRYTWNIIVPPGTYYRINGYTTIIAWTELR